MEKIYRFIEDSSFCWFFPKGKNDMDKKTHRNVVVNGERESLVSLGWWVDVSRRNNSCNRIQISAYFTRTLSVVFSKFLKSQVDISEGMWYVGCRRSLASLWLWMTEIRTCFIILTYSTFNIVIKNYTKLPPSSAVIWIACTSPRKTPMFLDVVHCTGPSQLSLLRGVEIGDRILPNVLSVLPPLAARRDHAAHGDWACASQCGRASRDTRLSWLSWRGWIFGDLAQRSWRFWKLLQI